MDKSFDAIISKIMLHELLGPLAKAEAEMKYINNFPLKEANGYLIQMNKKMHDQELNIKDESDMEQWRKNHNLIDEQKFKQYVEYRAKRVGRRGNTEKCR